MHTRIPNMRDDAGEVGGVVDELGQDEARKAKWRTTLDGIQEEPEELAE
jgi:hypothetical protein